VQCVAGVLNIAVERIERELLPLFPNVDGVVGLEHSYGCGVAIDAPGAEIPIRTLRHISLNPNFGGEVMVVSLGCENCSQIGCCRPVVSRSKTSEMPLTRWTMCVSKTMRMWASCP